MRNAALQRRPPRRLQGAGPHRILTEYRDKVAARTAEILVEVEADRLPFVIEVGESSGIVGDLVPLLWMVPVGRRRRAGADAVAAAARALMEDPR